ncbi:MAG: hypothetical protein KDD61_16265, partial [Bdellovibrionales bacterium]|nr:hypothetical protein [Bdellovibrionales bacterium]
MILNKQDLNTQALKNLLACLLFLASPALAEKKLLVMATTDLHGQIAPLNSTSLAGQTVGIGGISILSSYIKALRKSRTGAQILVDAGDLFQGTMESNTLEGSPIVELYNYLRVDATAIGNHEFDFGPQGPDRVQVQSTQDPLGAI